MKLVYLEWEDAKSRSGWHDEDEVEDFISRAYIVRSVGFILKETPKRLVICADWAEDGDEHKTNYANFTMIPKTWIRKRKVLAAPKSNVGDK